jgi:hypothetical protein
MEVVRNGAAVQWNGQFYNADVLKCPKCRREVYSGFSEEPITKEQIFFGPEIGKGYKGDQ